MCLVNLNVVLVHGPLNCLRGHNVQYQFKVKGNKAKGHANL